MADAEKHDKKEKKEKKEKEDKKEKKSKKGGSKIASHDAAAAATSSSSADSLAESSKPKNSAPSVSPVKDATNKKFPHVSTAAIEAALAAKRPPPVAPATGTASLSQSQSGGDVRKKAITVGRSKFPAGVADAAAAEDPIQPLKDALPVDKKSKVIDLSGRDLTSLPSELFEYQQLEMLTLRKNRLNSLPAELGQLKQLRMLGVSENNIIELPVEICTLDQLIELDLRKNKLHRLPPEIGRISSLQKLFVRNNQLSVLPAEIGELARLETLLLKSNHLLTLPDQLGKLTNLKVLDLHQNELRSLNANIGKLKLLTDLDLAFNHLTALPKLKHLKVLNKLSVASNQLAVFPPEIAALKELKTLDLEGNKITVLPPEIGKLLLLEDLCLTKNALTSLPAEIGELTNMRRLSLCQNELQTLPVEMKSMKKLEELDLRNNPLCTNRPDPSNNWKATIIPNLTALKIFRMGNTGPAALIKPIPKKDSVDEAGLSASSRLGSRVIAVGPAAAAGGATPGTTSPTGASAGGSKRPNSIGHSATKDKKAPTIFNLFAQPEGGAGGEAGGSELENSGGTPGRKIDRVASVSAADTHNPMLADLLASLDAGTTSPNGVRASAPPHSLQLPPEGLSPPPGNAASTPKSPTTTTTSQRRISQIARKEGVLLQSYSAKEDMNKAGLMRGKKTAVPLKGGTAHGKAQFQMEDVHLVEFPYAGDAGRALFCVFDGHAGPGAALAAKEHLPRVLLTHLKDKEKESKGLPADLAEILPLTFLQTDEAMREHEYEGTTATAVLIWTGPGGARYLQAANVGDSRAYLVRESSVVRLTKDHKLSEEDEKARMANAGLTINDGQTRINGLAVTRALGDRFAKDSNSGMIAVPNVSDAIKLEPSDRYLIVASDGLWDIVSGAKAAEICDACPDPTSSEAMATALITTAVQSTKCQDNVTVIVAIL